MMGSRSRALLPVAVSHLMYSGSSSRSAGLSTCGSRLKSGSAGTLTFRYARRFPRICQRRANAVYGRN